MCLSKYFTVKKVPDDVQRKGSDVKREKPVCDNTGRVHAQNIQLVGQIRTLRFYNSIDYVIVHLDLFFFRENWLLFLGSARTAGK